MAETDSPLIVLDASDTVAVARRAIEAGEKPMIDGRAVTISQRVAMGHKLARRAMRPGDKVLKYGAPIGSATAEIAVGDHVHLHNMKSDYTRAYALNEDGSLA